MNKIEKQALPVFFDDYGKPTAILMFIKGQRVIYMLQPAGEDEIINLYEKKETKIKGNKTKDEEEE